MGWCWLALVAALISAGGLKADPNVVSVITNGLFNPFGVAVDGTNNYYLTDDSHRVLLYSNNSGLLSVLAGINGLPGYKDGPGFLAQFYSPKAAVFYRGGLVVADSGNHVLRYVSVTGSVAVVSTFAGYTNVPGPATNANRTSVTFNTPVGLVTDSSNNLFIADTKNNAIRKLDTNDNVTTIATGLFEPQALAVDTNGVVYVADTRNQAVVMLTPQSNGSYTSSLLAGSSSRVFGTNDAIFATNALFNLPAGALFVSTNTGLLISDSGNNSLRQVYQNAALSAFYGVPIWSVATYAGAPGVAGLADGLLPAARFNSPKTLTLDTQGNLLVVDSGNNALRRIQLTPPRPQLAAPVIGYVTIVTNAANQLASQLVAITDTVFNNDQTIAISVPSGATGWWISTNTPSLFQAFNVIPGPNVLGSQQAPFYFDGMRPDQVPSSLFPLQTGVTEDITVNALATANGSNPSPLVQARIQYVVSPPIISGDNPSSFQLFDNTTNAQMYFTLTNPGTNNVPVNTTAFKNGSIVSLVITGDVVFYVQAFKAGYQPSPVIAKTFSLDNFSANRISLGFAWGEASSSFVAGQGQHFFAPITLTLLPSQTIYGLQFNLGATNLSGTNILSTNIWGTNFGNVAVLGSSNLWITNLWSTNLWGTNLTATNQWVTNFWVSNWQSSVPNSNLFLTNFLSPSFLQANPSGANLLLSNLWGTNVLIQVVAPPALNPGAFDFKTSLMQLVSGVYLPIPPVLVFFGPAPPNTNTVFTNTAANLLGVGWFERLGETNLFNTKNQDLITYSIAHDTLFSKSGGQVVVGAFDFPIPSTADFGESYRVQVGRPSANSDGVGGPASDVFIDAASGGTRIAGSVNAVKDVTVGIRPYLVGDVAPFRWLNAGDFGDQTLLNNDVQQIFNSAVYGLNMPPTNSDFFDAMDASNGSTNGVWNGSNTSINTITNGDGVLNVDDVFVVFRRALDPTLTNYLRYWTNGVRVAAPTNNLFRGHADLPARRYSVNRADLPADLSSILLSRDVPTARFVTSDAQVQPGQRLVIPVTAQITGRYPIRVLMLNLSVDPLDGSPAITEPIQFNPVAGLGAPMLAGARGAATYAAAWLDENVAGVWATNLVGALQVTIPTNATASSAYRVSFAHISASPNGLVLFPQSILPGVLTVGNRQSSSWNDRIPDLWRLRYFGTVSDPRSAANADPDSDGMSNWTEYLAGTDPLDPNSALRLVGLRVAQSLSAGTPAIILHWPSTAGLQYAVESTPSLLNPNWTPLSALLTGTGQDLEYLDAAPTGGTRYYRVRLAR